MRETCNVHRLLKAAVGIAVWLSMSLAPGRAIACSCTEGEQPCSEWTNFNIVFEGTVASIKEFPLENVITFRDVKAWRGRPQTTVVTKTGGGSCGYEFFKVGERYLVAPYRDTDGTLQASGCGGTRPLKGAEGIVSYLATLNGPPERTHVFGSVWAVTTSRYSESSAPIAGSRVRLKGPSDVEVTTDVYGQFSASGIPHGYYTATASIPGSNVILEDVGFQLSALVPHACASVQFVYRPPGVRIAR